MQFSSRLSTGDVIGGRYKIEKKLGSGGTSYVYLAEDLKLPGKRWAIKETLTAPDYFGNLEEEARLLIQLHHARLPHVIDFFPPDSAGYTYLIMDYIQGVTLDVFLEHQQGRMSLVQICNIAGQICEGLMYLHQHDPPIVYRDLKPSNLMIDAGGEVRFIDFGIARHYKHDQTEDTVKLGTIGFASPEQYGGRQTDTRSDLYSLGALLLYLVTGGEQTEWTNISDKLLASQVPASLYRVVKTLLHQRPEERYSSAAEVKIAIETHNRTLTSSQSEYRAIQPGGRTKVIGVMGTSPGVGVTHTCILLAHTLKQHFNNIMIMECGGKSTAFAALQQRAHSDYRNDGGELSHVFRMNQIVYHRAASRGQILNVVATEGGVVILDLGNRRTKDIFEELMRADLAIVVGSGAKWRVHELYDFHKSSSTYPRNKWLYAIPGMPLHAISYLRRTMKTSRVVPIPFEIDPFEPAQDVMKEIEAICRPIISGESPKRWGSMIRQFKRWGGIL
ncbi:serine/threonine-protein kinase [Paenibacillus shirakamiensis]|uniref:non-specific serine/threonine protein kinase n=1 Tax=Paenibacillus shirakamiensis TaxID=1265935 RepID=A0ABS4JFF0_9BACL|nr:serine/threonine-protein kinase [Paenibacillus shirakamiensis]MBP1999795.1 serine/threonine-protein kinase [Paenibacillus shirakamiensis]